MKRLEVTKCKLSINQSNFQCYWVQNEQCQDKIDEKCSNELETKIFLNSFGKITLISFSFENKLNNEDVVKRIKKFRKLCGLSEKCFGKSLQIRYKTGLIDCLTEFLEEDWINCYYLDLFKYELHKTLINKNSDNAKDSLRKFVNNNSYQIPMYKNL